MQTATKTVREIAIELPQATRVFEKLGIDYCCGGNRSLEEACESANLSLNEVLQALEREAAPPSDGEVNWESASLRDIIQHIVAKHHAYVKSEAPRLQQLAAKVSSKHGEKHPELLEIREVFDGLAGELASHLMKEEQILFPYVVEMEAGRSRGASCFGTVQNPIRMMTMEHDSAGEALRQLKQASHGYQAPADACVSYQTFYRALAEFEADLHQHIHLENNLLFPRAVAMEAARR